MNKLTNEKIEEIIQTGEILQVTDSLILILALEVREIRRLANPGEDLGRKILNEALLHANETKHDEVLSSNEICWLKGAESAVPLIRAEREAEIQKYIESHSRQVDKVIDLQNQVASQATEIERLKVERGWIALERNGWKKDYGELKPKITDLKTKLTVAIEALEAIPCTNCVPLGFQKHGQNCLYKQAQEILSKLTQPQSPLKKEARE